MDKVLDTHFVEPALEFQAQTMVECLLHCINNNKLAQCKSGSFNGNVCQLFVKGRKMFSLMDVKGAFHFEIEPATKNEL